jgi:hypothetical protein
VSRLRRYSATSSSNPLRRTFLEVNWRKLRREELTVWRTFDRVFVTSPRDLAIVQAHVPQVRCILSPNGVDLDEFTPPAGGAGAGHGRQRGCASSVRCHPPISSRCNLPT